MIPYQTCNCMVDMVSSYSTVLPCSCCAGAGPQGKTVAIAMRNAKGRVATHGCLVDVHLAPVCITPLST